MHKQRPCIPILALVTVLVFMLGINARVFADDLDSMAKEAASQLRKGDERARQVVESFVKEGESDPDKRDMIGVAAHIYLNAGQYELSAQTYEKAIKFQPNRAVYYADMALVYDRMGKLDKALAAGERSVQLAPNDPLNKVNLARYYIEHRDITKGLDLAKQALALATQKSDTDTAMQAQIMLVLVQTLDRSTPREIIQAREELVKDIASAKVQGDEEAVQRGMDALRMIEAFSRSTNQQDKKTSSSAPTKVPAATVQKHSPAPTATNNAKQVIKLRNGNSLEGTIIRQDDHEVTIDVPQAGQVTFARAEIATIEALYAGSIRPATVEKANQRLKSTMNEISQAILEGGDKSGVLNNAEAALASKNYEAALTAFDQVEARKGTLEVDIMSSPIKTSAIQQALSSLEQEVQSKPDDASLHFYLGRFYRFIGIMTPIVTSHDSKGSTTVGDKERKAYLTKAAEQFRSAQILQPSRHEAAYYLAKTYSLLLQFEEALASVQNAVKSAPRRIDYQDYQAGLYLATGRFAEAAAAYEALLKEPIAGRKEVEFALEKMKLLNQLTASKTGEQKSQVLDQFEGTAVLKFMDARLDAGSFIGRKPEDLTALEQKIKDGHSGDEWSLSMQQDGHLLNAMDAQGVYSGFTAYNAFVLGSQQSAEGEGCQIIQRSIITGQLKNGTLRVTNSVRGIVDHPEKCPKALGNAETIWEGSLKKENVNTN